MGTILNKLNSSHSDYLVGRTVLSLRTLMGGMQGSQMGSSCCCHGGLIHWNNSSVGVSDQAVVGGNWDGRDGSITSIPSIPSISSMGQGWGSSVGNGTFSSEVVSSSSHHSRFVSRDHGTVGVCHQGGVQVQWSGVASGVGPGGGS